MCDALNAKKGFRPFLMPTHWVRAEDDWCSICLKPSVVTTPLVQLCLCGVGPWGTVTGCKDCRNWVFRNILGVITNVNFNEVWGKE